MGKSFDAILQVTLSPITRGHYFGQDYGPHDETGYMLELPKGVVSDTSIHRRWINEQTAVNIIPSLDTGPDAWATRMAVERIELAVKIKAARKFVDENEDVPGMIALCLAIREQLIAMDSYLLILDKRLQG